jgi:hypothetical protein
VKVKVNAAQPLAAESVFVSVELPTVVTVAEAPDAAM